MSKETKFDGNYHCAYCGKVFRIPTEQVEFIKHQKECQCKTEQIMEH